MVISILYIIFSDRITSLLFGQNAVELTQVQTIKGLVYVMVTSVIIFILINREIRKRQKYILDLKVRQQKLKGAKDEVNKARDSLARRNKFIETILENLPIGLAVNRVDEGRATYMNHKFKEIYGWSDEDIRDIEEFFLKVYPDETYRNEIMEKVYEDIRSRDPERMKWSGLSITTKTGKKKIIEAQNIPLFDQDLMISTVQDITGKVETEKVNKEYQESLRNLTKELLITEEKHRKEIAGNIHDNLNQTLVIAKMHITQLTKNIADKQILERLQSASEYIEDAIANSRKITYDLSPPVLYQLGLAEAVVWLSEKLENESGLQIKLSLDHHPKEVPESHLILTYRVIQELLTNIVKHSGATMAEVVFRKKNSDLHVNINDNGKGFNTREELNLKGQGDGFGLFAVRERVHNLNGTITIKGMRGKGTSIDLIIPLTQ